MSLKEKINNKNIFSRLAAHPAVFSQLTNFSPQQFSADLIPLVEEVYFEFKRRQSRKFAHLPSLKPRATQSSETISKSVKADWEAKISRDRYRQAEAAAMIKKARIASEIEQVKLRDELDEAIRTLTKAKRKSLEAAENKYRDELQNVLLLYFFRRRFNLTFECLAQIFRFKNRSSAIRHFNQARGLIEDLRKRKMLPSWLILKVEKSLPEGSGGSRSGLARKKIKSLEQLITMESAFAVLTGDSSIKPTRPAAPKSSDAHDFYTGEPLSPKHFVNDSIALRLIVERRWGNQIRCPDCQARKIYLLGKIQRGGAAAEKSTAGFSRLKCGHPRCGKVFSPFSRTVLASCRLAPAQIVKAVYLAATCSRARHYTIEKYAAEVGITAKTARRLVALLDQFSGSANVCKMAVHDETPAEVDGQPKDKPRNFYEIRQALPFSADELLVFLLQKPRRRRTQSQSKIENDPSDLSRNSKIKR